GISTPTSGRLASLPTQHDSLFTIHSSLITPMNKKTIKEISWQGKKALVRVDFNVPQDEDGHITGYARIRAALPTIQYLLDHGAAVLLMSHLGRPKGGPDPKYSMKVTADHLATLVTAP